MNLDELAGEHPTWCHSVGHGDCCGAECDCGLIERRAAIQAALLTAYRNGLADCANATRINEPRPIVAALRRCSLDCDPGGNSEDHRRHTSHDQCETCPHHN